MGKTASLIEAVATTDRSFYIVGLGASAGGLEALEVFFEKMPTNSGMAFVVVQHLSPDFKSLMDQLLGRKTSIPIQIIEDGVRVKPDNIYLLPPKKEAIISNGTLLLNDRSQDDQLRYPIDHFFRSLAQDAQSQAIGVILSGTGTDGSRGIKEIRATGGLVVSQSESSAKFDGMPRSAVETGIVDMVLPPAEIALALCRYTGAKGTESIASADRKDHATPGPFEAILSCINSRYTLDFTSYKTATIARRIQRRLVLSGTDDLESYARLVQRDDEELDRMYHDLLIGVTEFFRDREVFEKLEKQVIPKLMGNLDEDQEFRAWVAGCATGEEAYSLAILVAEYLESAGDARPVRIFASDVHTSSLAIASRGEFQPERLEGVSAERLAKFFIQRSDGFHVSPELHKMVVFTPHNVLRNAPFTKLNLITCRNLLIYLTAKAQRKVLSLFHFGLRRGGVLCLGASESLAALEGEFDTIDEQARLFTKHSDRPLPVDTRETALTPIQLVSPQRPVSKLSGALPPKTLLPTYDKLLDAFMPAAILVSPQREIMHVFGGAGRYLAPRDGRHTNDLHELAAPELRASLGAGFRRIGEQHEAIRFDGIEFGAVKPDTLSLTLWRLTPEDPNSEILVQFETSTPSELPFDAEIVDARSKPTQEFQAIQRELEQTQDNLQATIEELQSTNEELQAANEQLTSSNEELQSTNEELHSVNEELYTVNAEHQRKIDQLTELTDDMDNLLNSTDMLTVFLDRKLCLRRFTPDVAGTFSLIPQDIGRRFDHFTHKLKNKFLIDELNHVLETSQPLEKEVSDSDGTWFLQRIRPYMTRSEVDGVVLTLINITSLKLAESRLKELSEIVEQSDDAIYRVDMDGKIRTWNRGAAKLYGYEASSVIGKNIQILSPDDLKNEPLLYLDRIRNGIAIDHVETTRLRVNGTRINVSLTVSPLWDNNQVCVGASVVARDVTKQKQAESEIRDAVRQRDTFLAMLSHELRNPLAAIVNASNLLRLPGVDADTQREARDVAETQLQHVTRLLDDLLDVARMTNNKLTLHLEVVDMKRSVMDAIECVKHRMDEKRQQLTVESPNEPVFVKGDPGRLQQAQVNLLVNAVKYSPPESLISLSLSSEDNDAVIAIRDESKPITEVFAKRIFQPFVQADDTLDRSQGGMGLGLPLVHMIAQAHGGSAELTSGIGYEGNEFTLRIPLTNEQVMEPRPEVATPSLEGTRLLLIEDNDGIRTMLAKCLQLKGFDVKTASDGSVGLELIQQFSPDFAIIDIGLPDINGYQVAQRIRKMKNHKHTTLLAVTGYGRKEDIQKAKDAGFDTHLLKPIDPRKLVEKLSELYAQTRTTAQPSAAENGSSGESVRGV